jgi:hypothetical protein
MEENKRKNKIKIENDALSLSEKKVDPHAINIPRFYGFEINAL